MLTLFWSYLELVTNFFVVKLPDGIAAIVASLSDYLPLNLTVLFLPFLYGFSMVLFSWILIYYDSKVPGVYPPSPVSPRKIREGSGHTFHLGYTVGLVNGFTVFVLSLWHQLSN